jgi:hypothetical protein
MADAIDNLAQDLNQVGVNPYEYAVLTDEGYVNTIPNPNFVEPYAYPNPPRFGLPEQPSGMFDPVLDYGSRQWLDRRIRSPNPIAQDLSNPSTLATGGEIDYNVRDQPTERINIGNTDEQDALIRTGIGTTLDPKTEDFYGVKGLVPPDQAGGFVGVDYLTPKQIEDLTAGQTPSSHPEEFITRGKTILIPGRGFPTYRQGIDTDGNISYINNETGKVDFTVPSVKGYPGVPDLSENPNLKLPFISTKTTDTSVGSTPFTPSPVGAYQPVGSDERTTASEGGFDNTGGNVTVGPDNRAAGPGDTADVFTGPRGGEGPGKNPFIDSPYKIFTGSGIDPDFIDPSTGKEHINNTGDKWNFRLEEWKYADVPATTPPVTTTPPGGGTTTTPPGGGTTTTPPGGGVQPGGGVRPGTGTGTNTGTYTGTPLPTREPVIPLVRKETVIPTKGTKEVPLPDRQADPFAKLYADLLANSQQQQDQYRYINYDPEQIMNAAMSGFRRRGAMRSLQGY